MRHHPLMFYSRWAVGLLAGLCILQAALLVVTVKPRRQPTPTPPRPLEVRELDARVGAVELHVKRS
jgi:hypothetical protein